MKTAIVGAGISGLATAHAVLSGNPQAEVTVFEAAPRVGGKVWTEISAEGFICEGGVNGFLDKVPETLQLCIEIGLAPVTADAAAEKRYIFSREKLHLLPGTPAAFLVSPLLSVRGRLRVLHEVLIASSSKDDETLAEFACRRLGREAFEKLIDPMASGVFAGDAERLSLKSCFPRIHEVEAQYGSLIRGLAKLQMKARSAGQRHVPGPGPGGRLTSFGRGMTELTDTLAERLGSRLRVSAPAESISRAGGGYTLHLADGQQAGADALILAVPAYAQASLLRDFDKELAALVRDITYPPLAVVCLGYERRISLPGLGGFGFLVPSRERRSILGTIVDSNVFPGRAPDGQMLLRSMVGGARSPSLAELPDDLLLDRVRSDLKAITGLVAEPVFCRIFRHDKAIPQYAVGHAARLAAIEQKLLRHPGLVLSGNAFRGVSLNDCVVNAGETASSLLAHCRKQHGPLQTRV